MPSAQPTSCARGDDVDHRSTTKTRNTNTGATRIRRAPHFPPRGPFQLATRISQPERTPYRTLRVFEDGRVCHYHIRAGAGAGAGHLGREPILLQHRYSLVDVDDVWSRGPRGVPRRATQRSALGVVFLRMAGAVVCACAHYGAQRALDMVDWNLDGAAMDGAEMDLKFVPGVTGLNADVERCAGGGRLR